MPDPFRATLSGRVLTIRFGEPEGPNTMDDAWFGGLERQLHQAQDDDRVRVVLLTADGKGFSAGGNLIAFQKGPLPQGFLGSSLAAAVRRLADFDKPIVTAVHGHAIGGGTTLLLHSDFVYAAADTTFQLPFTRLGIVPELGSTYLLAMHAGMRLANELILLGRAFDAQTAQRAGIVNEVLPADQVLAKAEATAQALAELPPGPLRLTKRMLKDVHRAALTMAVHAEGRNLERTFAGAEVQEAIAAVLEKRAPDFSGFR